MALLLLLLAAGFVLWLFISLGGDGQNGWDSETMQILVGVLAGLSIVGAVAVVVWPPRG